MPGRRVMVFAQAGCPACTEYMPRIGRLAGAYRWRGLQVQPVDINTKQGRTLAKKLGIDATPTTVVLRGAGSFKMVGAVGDEQIAQILAAAIR